MKKDKKLISVTTKVSKKTIDKIKYICDFYGLNRSEVLRTIIDSEYVKVAKIKESIQKKQKTD